MSSSILGLSWTLVRGEVAYVRRFLLLLAGAIFCYAHRGAGGFEAVTGFALLLALLTFMGREGRREAAVFLETLPLSRGRIAVASAGLDLLPVPALLLASRASGQVSLASAPAFLLAVMWGIAWSRGQPTRWTSLWCVVSLAIIITALRVSGAIGLSLACVATIGWLLVQAPDRMREDVPLPAGALPPAKRSTVPLPLWPSTLTREGSANIPLVLMSLSMVYAAIFWAPTVFNAIMPIAIALAAANLQSAAVGGPAREFFLTRPIGRVRYHAAAVGLGLAVTVAPPLAELTTAHLRSEARLAEDIHDALCAPDTLGHRPGSDDREAWANFYGRGLRRQMGLPRLPAEALERNPDLRGWSYLPSPTLRAAVRSAWEARQVRIAFLSATVFLAVLWLALATSSRTGGWGERVGAATRWSLRSLAQVAVLPLIWAGRNPEWLFVPLWLLVPALALAALGLGRALLRFEVV
jgi:hypothetical protein